MNRDKLIKFKLNLMRAQQFCLINAIRDTHPELDRQAWCQKALDISMRGVHELSELEQASLLSHQNQFKQDVTLGDFHQRFHEFLQELQSHPSSQEYLDFIRRNRMAEFQGLMDEPNRLLFDKIRAQISVQIGITRRPEEVQLNEEIKAVLPQVMAPDKRQALNTQLNTLAIARQTFGRLLPEQMAQEEKLNLKLEQDTLQVERLKDLEARLKVLQAQSLQSHIENQDLAKLKITQMVQFTKAAIDDSSPIQTIDARVVELDSAKQHYAIDIEGLNQADYEILQNYGYTRSESPISRAIEQVGQHYYRRLILDQNPLNQGLRFSSNEAAHKSALVLDLFEQLRGLQQEEGAISHGNKKDKIRRFSQVYERARKVIARLALTNHQSGGVQTRRFDNDLTPSDGPLLSTPAPGQAETGPQAQRFTKDEALHTALNQALATLRIARGAHPSHILNFENLTLDITHGLGDYHQQKSKKVIYNSLEFSGGALHANEARDLMILMARHHEPALEAWVDYEAAAPNIREGLRAQNKAPTRPHSVDLIQHLTTGPAPATSAFARAVLLIRALGRSLKDTPSIISDLAREFKRNTFEQFKEYFKLINLHADPNHNTELERHRRAFQAFTEANRVKIRYQGLPQVLSNTLTDVMLSAADYASDHPNKFGLAVILSTLGGMGLLVPAQALFFQSLLTVLPGSNYLISEAVDSLQRELSIERAVETLSKALLGFEPELSVVAGSVLVKGLKTRTVGAFLSQLDHRRINHEFISSCGTLLSQDKSFNDIFSSKIVASDALSNTKVQGSVLRRILSIVPYGLKFILDSLTSLLFVSAGVIIPILPLMSALWPLRARSPQMFIKLVARSWAALLLQVLSRGILRPFEVALQAGLEFMRDVYHVTSRILGTSVILVSLIAPLATLSSYLAVKLHSIKFLRRGGRLPLHPLMARVADGFIYLREGSKSLGLRIEYALFNEGTGYLKALNGNRMAVNLKTSFDAWCYRLEDGAHSLQAQNLDELDDRAKPLGPALSERSNQYEIAGPLAALVPQLENVQRQLSENHLTGARALPDTEMRSESMDFEDCVAQMKQGLSQVSSFKRLKLEFHENFASVRAKQHTLLRINQDGSVTTKPRPQARLSSLQRDLMVRLAPSQGCSLHGGDVKELIELVQALRAKHPDMPIAIDASDLRLFHINEPALHQQLQQLLTPDRSPLHNSRKRKWAARPEPL